MPFKILSIFATKFLLIPYKTLKFANAYSKQIYVKLYHANYQVGLMSMIFNYFFSHLTSCLFMNCFNILTFSMFSSCKFIQIWVPRIYSYLFVYKIFHNNVRIFFSSLYTNIKNFVKCS